MYINKRVRFANNILIIYDYEKPLKINNNIKKENIEIEENSKEYIQTNIEELQEEKAKKSYINLANLNAKKDRFIDLVNANLIGNCFFVTLTYNNENVYYKNELKESNYNFMKFIQRYNYNLGFNLKYIVVAELQKKNNRNAWHYHCIFFDMPSKKIDLQQLHKCWGSGAVNVKKINKKTSGVGKYMSKYLFKDIADLVKHKKSYHTSKNLIKPSIEYIIEINNNIAICVSGLVIDLNKYNVESLQNYESFYNGKTTKTIFNKN